MNKGKACAVALASAWVLQVAYMEDDEVSPFLKKIEEVLGEFAGETYHFRYYLEEPLNRTKHDLTKKTKTWFEKS